SWRRRRAWTVAGMPASGRSLAPGSNAVPAITRSSVEALAVAWPQRTVPMQQQNGHAHELLDLGQRALVLLVALLLRSGRGQLGDVRQGFATLIRQGRLCAR